MPFVVDLMENKIFRARYERGLEEGIAKGIAQGRAKGRAKGRAEGRAEGQLEGGSKILLAQLKKRFGRLPVWAQKRIDGATAEQIEAWSMELLDAKTLEAVLGKR